MWIVGIGSVFDIDVVHRRRPRERKSPSPELVRASSTIEDRCAAKMRFHKFAWF